ncbi:MAG: leucine-rich repeat domain-containing protein [Opitutaceae bacterium]
MKIAVLPSLYTKIHRVTYWLGILYTIASTHGAQFDDFSYELINGETEVEITDYPETATGPVVIPDTIEGKPVTRIGDSAFKFCAHLTSITISENVTSIASESFSNCNGLTAITVPDSVRHIGESAFAHCQDLTNVTLGANVDNIDQYAFYACNNLVIVTFTGDAPTTFDSYIFESAAFNFSIYYPEGAIGFTSPTWNGYTSIELNGQLGDFSYKLINNDNEVEITGYTSGGEEHVSIPSTIYGRPVTSIAAGTFHSSTQLSSASIPSSITSISDEAFAFCDRLESVYFGGNAPETFGSMVFDNAAPTFTIYYSDSATGFSYPTWQGYATSLLNGQFGNFSYELINNTTEIEITDYLGTDTEHAEIPALIEGKPVTSIAENAFSRANLTSIHIPESVTNIGESAFDGCASLTSVNIPDGITAINRYAFRGCSFSSIRIPDSVKTIGFHSFKHCVNLTGLLIPDSVTSISDSAFSSCRSLKEIVIPDSVTGMGDSAFSNCIKLQNVTISNNLRRISFDAFAGCTSLTSIDIGTGTTTLGSRAFEGCTSLTQITIPEGVIKLENWVFYGCRELADVSLPNSLQSMGELTFNNCIELKNVNIPSSISTIPRKTFFRCLALKSITIPESVTIIEDEAFRFCNKLTAITIPIQVERIGSNAFNFCSSLVSAYFIGDAPSSFNVNAFTNTSQEFCIYYGSISSGFSSPLWNGYASEEINTTLHPKAAWLLEHEIPYTTPLDSDYNHDGVTLLTAYSLNLNPSENLANSLPQPRLQQGTLEISFYANRQDVTYSVKTCTDLSLGDWTTNGIEISPKDINGTCTASVSSSDLNRFLQLTVELL